MCHLNSLSMSNHEFIYPNPGKNYSDDCGGYNTEYEISIKRGIFCNSDDGNRHRFYTTWPQAEAIERFRFDYRYLSLA